MTTMKFVGGSLDGATIEVKGWVTPFFYAQSNITGLSQVVGNEPISPR